MTRLFLILIMVTQLGCASIFWQTVGGTVLGNIGAEIIKEEFNRMIKKWKVIRVLALTVDLKQRKKL